MKINGIDLNGYFLANELTDKLGIHIANISMFIKNIKDDEIDNILKLGNCTFIKKDFNKLPKALLKGVHLCTELNNVLPRSWFKEDLDVTDKELEKCNIATIIEIAGRKFYQFTNKFAEEINGKVLYILDKSDTESCSRNGEINGYVQLSKNKFLVWY